MLEAHRLCYFSFYTIPKAPSMAALNEEMTWKHIRDRYPDQHEITVDELVDSLGEELGRKVERWEVVALLKIWSRAGHGIFTVGRHTFKTRMSFHKSPKEASVVRDSKPTVPAKVRYESWPLSPGRTATLEFPSDLSGNDVERIAGLLRSYVAGTSS
jgi:hypothetical protein